jgi:UDP-N-acetylmuramoyl-L-alanyl-D-glutamate--2,6-diaminopimelate ligase
MAGRGAGIPGAPDLLGGGPADAVALHATLAALAARGAGAVAIELPADGWDGEALAFGHVIVLDGAGLEAVGAERLRQAQRGWVVLNHDDPACRGAARALDGRRRGLRLAAFSLDPGAKPDCVDVWVRAEGIEPLPRGVRIRVVTSAGRAEIDTRLLGRDSAAAMLAVLAVLLSRGATLDRARAALAAVPGMPGRMEAFGAGDAPLVVVDKADTPDALERALGQLRDHCRGRIITVFGSPCGREAHQRRRMGAVAERLSDSVIVTDDNPGGEDGDAICAAIVGGMRWPARSRIVRQRGLAIRRAIAVAGRGDAVLVAGKGRDNVQDMGELKVHFSDRAQVVQALGEWQGFGA